MQIKFASSLKEKLRRIMFVFVLVVRHAVVIQPETYHASNLLNTDQCLTSVTM